MTATCDRLVESLQPLDELGTARAAIVMALADRLDAARSASSAVALQAVPGIAKQLHDAIEALTVDSAKTQEFVAGLFNGS